MKKVTLYFKSGNIIKLKCKELVFTFDNISGKKTIDFIKPNIDVWMIDLNELEVYIVKDCLF